MQWSGRIGRYKFDHDFFAVAAVAFAKRISCRENGRNHTHFGIRGQANIDKSRPGDFGRGCEQCGRRQCGHNRFGNVARLQSELFRELQRTVYGKMPVRGVFRLLDIDHKVAYLRRKCGCQRLLKQCGDSAFVVDERGGHARVRFASLK